MIPSLTGIEVQGRLLGTANQLKRKGNLKGYHLCCIGKVSYAIVQCGANELLMMRIVVCSLAVTFIFPIFKGYLPSSLLTKTARRFGGSRGVLPSRVRAWTALRIRQVN